MHLVIGVPAARVRPGRSHYDGQMAWRTVAPHPLDGLPSVQFWLGEECLFRALAWALPLRHTSLTLHINHQRSTLMTSYEATDARTAADAAMTARTEPVPGERVAAPALGDETHLELVEEQLEAHTRPVQIGEVLLRKQVVTETRTIEVPVRREELVVERRAVERRPADEAEESAPDEFSRSLVARFRALQEGESIRLPLIEEEVVIQKRPVVYEEVLVGKRGVEETQQVSGTIRREELKVARRGEVEVSHVRRTGGEAASERAASEGSAP